MKLKITLRKWKIGEGSWKVILLMVGSEWLVYKKSVDR